MPKSPPADAFSLQPGMQAAWRDYLDALEPLRHELFRYCLGLTGDVWDAEDLVQDALLRVFGHLGKINAPLREPRAYLVRTATRLWIDRLRRADLERTYAARCPADEPAADDDSAQALRVRQAAAHVFAHLPPRERAAVLLKDVLGFSLEEAAAMLPSTVGAVKAALYRGRARLKAGAEAPAPRAAGPPRALVEAFVAALSAGDVEAVRALCLAGVGLDMVGGAALEGWGQARVAVHHAYAAAPFLGADPRWEVVDYLGEPIAVGYRTQNGVEGVNEIWRLEADEEGVSRLRLYCFTPEVIAEVAGALGVPALQKPHRSPP